MAIIMKATYYLETKHTDYAIAHIFEHAYMNQLYKFLANNGHKYISITGRQCRATTYLTKILLQFDVDDELDNLIQPFIADKHAFSAHDIQISTMQVECEKGYRYKLGFDQLIETCNSLGSCQFKNLSNYTDITYSNLTDVDSIGNMIEPEQVPQDFVLKIINLCIDRPTITDRVVLVAIADVLAELLHIEIDNLGGYIHGTCNFHDCTDDAILFKANAVFHKTTPTSDLEHDIDVLLKELMASYADKMAHTFKYFFNNPMSIDYAYNYLGVLGSSDNLQQVITAKNIKKTLEHLYVDSVVDDDTDENTFDYDNIANYLLR